MIQFRSIPKYLQAFIVLLIISIPLTSIAETQVSLMWDFNNPAPDGYRLYCREEGQSYASHEFVWQGDHSFNTCTIDGLDENTTYYFVVRAFAGTYESHDSNEVRFANGQLTASLSSGDGSASSGGGGGGGGGCFIQSFF